MADQDDVRRIAMSLPETVEADGHFSFSIGGKAFVWMYMERIDPKKARVPNPEAVAITISGEAEKSALMSADPDIYFTTDHYSGHRSILVHLSKIELDALEDMLTDAWYLRAPKALQRQFDSERQTEMS